MAYLSKFGNMFGWVPAAQGRIFFVAPTSPYYIEGRAYDASDNNDGKSPERALATLARAILLAGFSDGSVSAGTAAGTAGSSALTRAGDTIYLLEGTHTVTATPRVNVAGLSIVGQVGDRYAVGGWGARTNKYRTILRSTGTSIPLLSIEADDVEVAFLTLRPTAGFSAVIFRAANPDSTHFHDCWFDLASQVGNTGTYGIDWGYRADLAAAAGDSLAKHGGSVGQSGVGGQRLATGYVERCTFMGAAGAGRGLTIATAQVYVKDCWFHNDWGAWASPFVVATAAEGCVVDSTTFTTTGTMGCCIEGGNASVTDGVRIQFSTFPRVGQITSGLVIDNFGTNMAGLVENYQADATGGLLIAKIT